MLLCIIVAALHVVVQSRNVPVDQDQYKRPFLRPSYELQHRNKEYPTEEQYSYAEGLNMGPDNYELNVDHQKYIPTIDGKPIYIPPIIKFDGKRRMSSKQYPKESRPWHYWHDMPLPNYGYVNEKPKNPIDELSAAYPSKQNYHVYGLNSHKNNYESNEQRVQEPEFIPERGESNQEVQNSLPNSVESNVRDFNENVAAIHNYSQNANELHEDNLEDDYDHAYNDKVGEILPDPNLDYTDHNQADNQENQYNDENDNKDSNDENETNENTSFKDNQKDEDEEENVDIGAEKKNNESIKSENEVMKSNGEHEANWNKNSESQDKENSENEKRGPKESENKIDSNHDSNKTVVSSEQDKSSDFTIHKDSVNTNDENNQSETKENFEDESEKEKDSEETDAESQKSKFDSSLEEEFESSNVDLDYEGAKKKYLNAIETKFRSMVLNPMAGPDEKFQACKTPKNDSGSCRYVHHCLLPDIMNAVDQFMNYICIINDIFIGVCCPDHPVTVIKVKWDGTHNSTDNSTVTTPQECGVSSRTRIVGGEKANPKDYPWMAAIISNSNGKFFCGGSLINNRYVLTAAHCTFGVPRDQIIVRLGEYDFGDTEGDEQGEDFPVLEIKRHGQYSKRTLENDIALLKLDKPVTFAEHIKTICLPENKTFENVNATLAGWGNTKGGGAASKVLLEASFPVVTNKKCADTHGLPVSKNAICTLSTRNKGACNGDSGGPLMAIDEKSKRWYVIGVVSWGRKGCSPKFPTVYAGVVNYINWIKEHAV